MAAAATAPAASPLPAAASPHADEISAYLARTRSAIQQALRYPPQARRLRLQGVVRVRMTVGADGQPLAGSLAVLPADCPEFLAEAARQAVQDANLPLPPRPQLDIEAPIRFELQ